jgi:hypothetical protein
MKKIEWSEDEIRSIQGYWYCPVCKEYWLKKGLSCMCCGTYFTCEKCGKKFFREAKGIDIKEDEDA